MTFVKAVKWDAKLRLAIAGPSGSGKTYTALLMATILAQGRPIAVVDTEHGSAKKYADRFNFDVMEPPEFSPDTFVSAIEEAESAGYAVVILDSLSHAWAGKGGLLEIVDEITRRSKSANSYLAWKDATPKQNKMIDTIIGCGIHVIATLREKQGYVLEKDAGGKQVPRKVGLEPIQRDGVEYEFDVFCEMDIENTLTVTKTRCPALTGRVYPKPDTEPAATLLEWLKGEKPPAPAPDIAAKDKPPAQQPAATASNGKPIGPLTGRALLERNLATRVTVPATPKASTPERPWSAEYIREMLGKVIEKRYAGNTGEPNPKQLGLVRGVLGNDQERHCVLSYIFGKLSSQELMDCEVCALLDWLKPEKGPDDKYKLSFTVAVERDGIVRQALEEAGQLPLDMDRPETFPDADEGSRTD